MDLMPLSGTLWLLFLGVLLLILGHTDERAESWESVADSLGLTFQESWLTGPGKLTGAWDGLEVEISCRTRWKQTSDDRKTYFTVYEIDVSRAFPSHLDIVPKNADRVDNQVREGQRVRSGDDDFDEIFFITSSRPDEAREFLEDPASRNALMQLRSQQPFGFRIRDGCVRFEEEGFQDEGRFIARHLDGVREIVTPLPRLPPDA